MGADKIRLNRNLCHCCLISACCLTAWARESSASAGIPLYPAFVTAWMRSLIFVTLESYKTEAFSAAKLTLASDTPGTFFNCRSIIEAQEEQCMPEITRLVRSDLFPRIS